MPEEHIVPTNCNVLEAVKEYVNAGSLDLLDQYKRQSIRDLRLEKRPREFLVALLENPGGDQATELLEYFRDELRGKQRLLSLPRPIRDVFLVGWARMRGLRGWSKIAVDLQKLGFGGTVRAAGAVVYVGRTTGLLFGLLDAKGTPTGLFHEYFGVS